MFPLYYQNKKNCEKNQASRFPSGSGILLIISRLPDCTMILINYNYNHDVAVGLFFKTLMVSILDLATYISNIVIQPLQTPFRLAEYMCVHMIMYVHVCMFVCHLKKPFASELETNTNEKNVSQVSATLYTFMYTFPYKPHHAYVLAINV